MAWVPAVPLAHLGLPLWVWNKFHLGKVGTGSQLFWRPDSLMLKGWVYCQGRGRGKGEGAHLFFSLFFSFLLLLGLRDL